MIYKFLNTTGFTLDFCFVDLHYLLHFGKRGAKVKCFLGYAKRNCINFLAFYSSKPFDIQSILHFTLNIIEERAK